jgi:hypothetical protein
MARRSTATHQGDGDKGEEPNPSELHLVALNE